MSTPLTDIFAECNDVSRELWHSSDLERKFKEEEMNFKISAITVLRKFALRISLTMQTMVQTLLTNFVMPRKLQLVCLSLFLGLLSLATQPGFAQNPPPLNFGNNFFVTGDYIVAGAYGMATNFTTINGVSYAIGRINVPDKNPSTGIANPGITGATSVPQGAQIVAALLYWQAVEKVGSPGSGQIGYIRPLVSGGPAAPGYLISGTNVTGSTTVSWSAGGCGGGSTGKLLRTYRADVAGALPVDVNGNSVANGSFEVWLPSVGNATPLTLGATLVVIYRVLSGAGGPNIPLNAIVIYDGDYAQGNAQLTMTQQLQGFYDAAQNPVSRLTHIVGSGQSNKFQTVYLSSGTNSFVPLPFLYGNGQPAFPGYYGMWDNPTWTFTNANTTTNPGVLEDASNATTQVVPSPSNQGCVSWGAVIVSTTVKDTDKDGLLDSWENAKGYCDYSTNPSCSGSQDAGWVDLPNANPNEKDVYLQYDYMCSSVSSGSCAGASYSFDPGLAVDNEDNLSPHANAIDKVVAAYANHGIALHASPGHAITEGQPDVSCADSDPTCTFPNEPGTVGFSAGLEYIKNQTIDSQTGLIGCDPSNDQNCGPVFQHGKKDSYHYALFSHGVGVPNWFLSDGSLSSVSQSGSTVTFTTSSSHGISPIAGDNLCSTAKGFIGRVTVVSAISNPNLNGTYCAKAVGTPPAANKFAITLANSSTTATYTKTTDPNLGVANGKVTSISGFSDVGGQNSVISLGSGGWGPPTDPSSDGKKWQNVAGTFMHELGHTMALTHGGTFYNQLANNNYTPTFEVNCKPNVQSSMSYLFQFDLLEVPGVFNAKGNPLMVVDYSKEALTTLDENSPQPKGILNNTAYAKTAWFQLTSFAGGTPVSPHCDGTPLQGDPSTSYVSDFVNNFFWTSSTTTGNDINFNGNSDVMHGHNEWDGTPAEEGGVGPAPGLDLRQVSAFGTISAIGPGGDEGGLHTGGGGLHSGGGGLHTGGGGLHSGGGGLHTGGGAPAEFTHESANSYARPPRGLSITEEKASPRNIVLNWFIPTFGTVVQYNLYRSDAGGSFHLVLPGPGTQTTYTDTVTCNSGGYRYQVTAVTNNDSGTLQESSPSNTVPASGQALLTGCYTVTNLSSPATATGNSSVPITWTLTDDFWITPGTDWKNAITTNPVTRSAANTLFAIGPVPNHCKTQGSTTLLLNGNAQSGAGTFTNSGGQFTFTWNTKGFCGGSYTFQLKLDSNQTQTTTTPLLLK